LPIINHTNSLALPSQLKLIYYVWYNQRIREKCVVDNNVQKIFTFTHRAKFQFLVCSNVLYTLNNYALLFYYKHLTSIVTFTQNLLEYKNLNLDLLDTQPNKEVLQWVREARKKVYQQGLEKVFKKRFFSFMNKLLVNFFQFMLKLKIHVSFKKLVQPIKALLRYREFKFMISQVKRYIKRIKSFKFIESLYKVLWVSLKLKDSNFFLKWFSNRIESFPFKMHRYIPYLLTVILKKFSKRIFKQTSILGLAFSLRGKISATGDAKKGTQM